MNPVTTALQVLLTPSTILLVALGSTLGMILGAIPGLNGAMAIMILMPMTFSMDSNVAMAMLVAIYIGSISGSCIGAIMLGIPGTSSSIATVFDGYELTKKGDPVRALSAAVTCNFIGTTLSVIVAVFLSPIIARWAVKLGPWEYFSLCLCALAMVSAISKEDLVRGVLAVALAGMLACVGMSPNSGTPRFTFGMYQLIGGFDLISVVMGLFAGKTIILEYARRHGSSEAELSDIVKVSRYRFPWKDLKNNPINIIRSFFIGLWIGFLPGLGSALSNVVAYTQEKKSSKHPEEFGKGCIDGVIAPEIANNAATGGALIPTISLGIPGDPTTAILLGGLMIHGIEPGPLVFIKEPVFVNVVFYAVALAALCILIVQSIGMPLFPALLKVPYHYLYPTILTLCFVGSYLSTGNMFCIYTMIFFTAVGLFLEYFRIPITPFILTFILASLLEGNLRRAISYSDTGLLPFVTRPISAILLLVAVYTLVSPFIKDAFAKRKAVKGDVQ